MSDIIDLLVDYSSLNNLHRFNVTVQVKRHRRLLTSSLSRIRSGAHARLSIALAPYQQCARRHENPLQ
ncbi:MULTISPECIES: hypothetical protein [unclassified Bradyrhizobium]|jgi:hypothetical protein|uniref:hypothetical protein n=1 Tax=unclassified Bradyrhizobium TaxID=2631580 RepID=UPI00104A2E8C|nr:MULTISPECIES: hypothetical protein [unclassified Bradyrhizobium]